MTARCGQAVAELLLPIRREEMHHAFRNRFCKDIPF